MKRKITFQLTVTLPAVVGESEVSRAINSALDEPPCDWGDWKVSAAVIVDVKKFKSDK